MTKTMFVVAIATVMAVGAGCARVKKKGEEKLTPKTTDPQALVNSLGEKVSLEGIWISECLPQGSANKTPIKIRMDFQGNTFSEDIQHYQDPSCFTPSSQAEHYVGAFKLEGNNDKVAGAVNIELSFESLQWSDEEEDYVYNVNKQYGVLKQESPTSVVFANFFSADPKTRSTDLSNRYTKIK